MPTFTTQTASHEPCSGRQPRRIKVGGGWKATSVANNETRNMSHNVSHVKYNLHNLPESVIFANGNVLSFVYMADGRRVGTDRPADKDL